MTFMVMNERHKVDATTHVLWLGKAGTMVGLIVSLTMDRVANEELEDEECSCSRGAALAMGLVSSHHRGL